MEREQLFKELSEFIKLSYTEQMAKVVEAAREQLGDDYFIYLVDMNDERVVFYLYDYNTDKEEYRAFNYTISEESNVVFTSNDKVYPLFLTLEQREALNMSSLEEATEVAPQLNNEPDTQNGAFNDDVEEKNDDEEDEEGDKQEENAQENDDPQGEVNAKEAEPKEEEFVNVTTTASSSTLDNSEREELAAFRREKKVALIASYTEDLSEDLLKTFKNKVDEYSFDDLEVALALEFTKAMRQNKATPKNTNVPFSFGNMPSRPSGRDATFQELIKSRVK